MTVRDQIRGDAMPRFSCLVLWAHGFPFTEQVASQLEDMGNKIVAVRAVHWPKFCMTSQMALIYQFDPTKFLHLAGKSKYLGKYSPRAKVFFFYRPERPELAEMKERLRIEFNARRVPGGREHDHLFHLTDFSWDAWRLLRTLESESKAEALFSAGASGSREIEKDFHMGTFSSLVPTNSILVPILKSRSKTELVRIHETPHFEFVCGNEEPYRDYVGLNLGYGLRHAYSSSRFKKLIAALDETKAVISVQEHRSKYLVRDGTHRLAILAARGKSTVRARVEMQN